MKDSTTINCFAYLLKLVGQFPFEVDEIGKRKVKVFSISGIWFLIIFAFHFLCAQTVVGARIIEARNSFETDTGFAFKVASISYVVLMADAYVNTILWIMSVPKILKAWNLLDDYDRREELRDTHRSPLITCKKVPFGWTGLFMLFTSIANSYFVLAGNATYFFAAIHDPDKVSWSWLVRILGIGKLCDKVLSIHLFLLITNFCLSNTMYWMVVNGMIHRIRHIITDVEEIKVLIRSVEWIPKISLREIPLTPPDGCCYRVSKIFRKLQKLEDVFQEIQGAGNLYFLMALCCTTVELSIVSYIVTLSWVSPIRPYGNPPIFISILLNFFLLARLIVLLNTGHYLKEAVRIILKINVL